MGTDRKELNGQYFCSHIVESHHKLIKLGDYIKTLSSHLRNLAKIMDANQIVVNGLNGLAKSASFLLQRNMPISDLAMYTQTIGSLHQKFEQERINGFLEASKYSLIDLDSLYEKKMLTVKNYLKEYNSEDKIRLENLRKLKSELKKLKKKKDKSEEISQLMGEYENANFNLKSFREQALRKIMIDENIMFTAFMEIYVKIFKSYMTVNEKYSMASLRNTFNEIDNVIKDSSFISKEGDYVIKNPKEYLNDSVAVEIDETPLNLSSSPEFNNKSTFNYESELIPVYDKPLEVIHQFISNDSVKQIDLIKGDLIVCYTDVYDGWQYGININSKKKGWFPATFTRHTDDSKAKEIFDDYLKSIV